MSNEEEVLPIQEVWITTGGLRQRVYRGRKPEEVAWKVKYHFARGNNPEQLTPAK